MTLNDISLDKTILIELQYLPPVSFFQTILETKNICLEANENFVKSTYRNRCKILGSNGVQSLSIPILGGRNHRQKIKDVEIDNLQNWQKKHWMSLVSAYKSSPYFEFYEIDFHPFFHRKEKWLWDFNFKLLELLIQLLKVNIVISESQSFQQKSNFKWDFRNEIHPNKISKKIDFNSKPYMQVFQEKFDFQSDLSLVDLLFNEGPNAINCL